MFPHSTALDLNWVMKRAFTLIELLVVVAVIAILASLLFPVLRVAKAKAQQANCRSNLRQMTVGLLNYTHDHDDEIPFYQAWDRSLEFHYLWDLVGPYIDGDRSRDLIGTGETVRACPTVLDETWRALTRLSDAWAWLDSSPMIDVVLQTDYLNGRPYIISLNGNEYPRDLRSLFLQFRTLPVQTKVKTGQIMKPAEAMVFLDGVTGFGFGSPVGTSFMYPDEDGDHVGDVPKFEVNRAHFRIHRDGSQMSLLDGHVERVNYRKLWAYDRRGRVTHRFWFPE